MLRACLLTLLVAATLSGFVPARAASAPAAPEAGTLKRIADRRIAEMAASAPAAPATGQPEPLKGTLQVMLDPSMLHLALLQEIQAMLAGNDVSHEAAAKVCKQLKISVDMTGFGLGEIGRFQPGRGPPGVRGQPGVQSQLTVDISFKVPQHDPPLARPFLAAVAEQLQEKLREFTEGIHQAKVVFSLRVAEENLASARATLASLRKAQRGFYEEAGRTDLSRESIMAEAKALETEGQKLQMDQIGHTARQKALTARIADIALKAERRAAEDPVAAELKKVVDLRERELDLAKKRCDAGQMPTSEVGAIEIKVAEARAEWLKRREAAGNLAGRDLLAKLNEELLTLEVDNAETAARYEHIEKQLAKNRKILPIADGYQDNVVDALRLAEREVQNALQQRSDAERQARDFVPPTVVAVPSE